MSETLEIIIRVFVAFIATLIITRLIGKQMIAQLTYHDFVAAITIGSIAGNLAFNIKISFFYFILSLALFSGIAWTVTWISLKSRNANRFVSGEPITVMENGTILTDNLRKMNYSLDALELGLRQQGIFHKEEVEKAILEINGSLSVLKKPAYRNVTKQELDALLKKIKEQID